jgi:hypothetical protein
MWEPPDNLWRRLKLGREEFLQRLLTTLIVGGDPPPWNAPRPPDAKGAEFLRALDELAHGAVFHADGESAHAFVDEYLLPKIDEAAMNGWPDWGVLWTDRVWIIELKTEPGSHRPDQLPYYLTLAAAAHPSLPVDLTYITGPLTKPAPGLGVGQRYSHLEWQQVLPVVEAVWGGTGGEEVGAYVSAVRTIVENLTALRPSEQRAAFIGSPVVEEEAPPAAVAEVGRADGQARLVELARATAADGRQRGVGATSPEALESLRAEARAEIRATPAEDPCRYVMPWVWDVRSSTGSALTQEGNEFGYELRFSRYQTLQVKD